DVPKDPPQLEIAVLRYDGDECDKGRMTTKIELTLEQSQQGVSNDVLISIKGFEELKRNEEVAETMAETMEQYMSKTRADYDSGVARPKIEDKDNFELKGQFLKERRTNTFSGSDHEDANEYIEKVLEIEMQEVVLFYNGLDVPTRQILDSRGAIPLKTAVDTKVAIQEMVEYSQKLDNGTSRTRSTETFDELEAIQAQLNNLGREIKKIRALMDAAIRNQGALIKTLEIQIEQMSKLMRGHVDDLMPTIQEEDMDAYRDERMGNVIFGEPLLREVMVNARRFKGMITIHNGPRCKEIDEVNEVSTIGGSFDLNRSLSLNEYKEEKEKALCVELKRMYEPNAADVFWKLERYMHDLLTWKLYTNCGVHQVSSTRRHDIFMFKKILSFDRCCNAPLRKEDRYILIMAFHQSIFKKA
nr:hypothetical protein [Tanacetum cinerariifolium]